MNRFSDLFRYDDGALPVAADTWQLVSGSPEVLDNRVLLPAAGSQAVVLTAAELESLEHYVKAEFRATLDNAAPYFGVMVRAELSESTSPPAVLRSYLVTVAGDGTLTVESWTQGAGVVSLGTVAVDLDVDELHTLMVKVRDVERGVAQVLVYLDDMVTPKLTVTDRAAGKPSGKYVGFDLSDSTGGQTIELSGFWTGLLRSAVIKNPMPVPALKTFGDLIYEVGFRVDRSGNSQFSAAMLGEFINHAQAEVCIAEGFWKWLRRSLCFTTAQGAQVLELPAHVAMIYDLTETSSGRQLAKCNLQDINRTDPARARSGVPSAYAEQGSGDNGGLVIIFDRTTGGCYSMVLDFYAKHVPMVDDSDLPLVPPEYVEVLIWGALERAFQHSDDQKGFGMAMAKKAEMIRLMRRDNQRTAKGLTMMTVANQTARSKVFQGAGPVTRAEQLGF